MVSQTSLPLLDPAPLRGPGMAEEGQGAPECHDCDPARHCRIWHQPSLGGANAFVHPRGSPLPGQVGRDTQLCSAQLWPGSLVSVSGAGGWLASFLGLPNQGAKGFLFLFLFVVCVCLYPGLLGG